MLAQVFGGKVQVFFSIEILRSLAAMRTQVSKVLGVNVFSWQNRTFYPIQNPDARDEGVSPRFSFSLCRPPPRPPHAWVVHGRYHGLARGPGGPPRTRVAIESVSSA